MKANAGVWWQKSGPEMQDDLALLFCGIYLSSREDAILIEHPNAVNWWPKPVRKCRMIDFDFFLRNFRLTLENAH